MARKKKSDNTGLKKDSEKINKEIVAQSNQEDTSGKNIQNYSSQEDTSEKNIQNYSNQEENTKSVKNDTADKKSEAVEIDRNILQEILQRQERLEDENKILNKEIEKLSFATDKKRLAHWQSIHSEDITRTAKISTWRDDLNEEPQLIFGWKMVKDDVEVRPGAIREVQIIRLYIDNGDAEPRTKDVEYLYFVRNSGDIKCDIVDIIQSKSGTVYVLRLPDGRQVEMDPRFINAF